MKNMNQYIIKLLSFFISIISKFKNLYHLPTFFNTEEYINDGKILKINTKKGPVFLPINTICCYNIEKLSIFGLNENGDKFDLKQRDDIPYLWNSEMMGLVSIHGDDNDNGIHLLYNEDQIPYIFDEDESMFLKKE